MHKQQPFSNTTTMASKGNAFVCVESSITTSNMIRNDDAINDINIDESILSMYNQNKTNGYDSNHVASYVLSFILLSCPLCIVCELFFCFHLFTAFCARINVFWNVLRKIFLCLFFVFHTKSDWIRSRH